MLGLDAKAARATWTAAMVLLFLGVVYMIRETLLLFVVALMFAYLLFPLFEWLEVRWRARTWALVVTFLLVLGFLGGFGVFIGTHIGQEATQLASQLRQPGMQQQIAEWRPFDIPVGAQITEHYSEIAAAIPGLTLKVLAASTNLLDLVIIPILAFFFLKDGRHIMESFFGLFDGRRGTVEETMADVHVLMLQYMRALLLLCLATLAVFSVVLSLMRVPYSILLASIAFMLEFIPLVGPLCAAGVILAVSLFSGYPHVLGVAVFLGIYRLFQDYVLSPQLMRRGVELHPLVVIFGVFAGGEIGGVAGIFLSVPALALLRLMYRRATRVQEAYSGD
jgi:predicted PurR-regulated permease PerM